MNGKLKDENTDLTNFKYKEEHANEVQTRFGKKVIECNNDFESIKAEIEQFFV